MPSTSVKETKAEAHYGHSNGKDKCADCKHYQGGLCSKVKGYIDPDMWCKYFDRKG